VGKPTVGSNPTPSAIADFSLVNRHSEARSEQRK
jgi:hypothetical protein